MDEYEKVLLAELVKQAAKGLEMQLVEVNLTELLQLDAGECTELVERLASRDSIIGGYDLVVSDDTEKDNVVFMTLTQEAHDYFLELARVFTVNVVSSFVFFDNEYSTVLYYTVENAKHHRDNNYYTLTELYEIFEFEDYSLSEIREVLLASANEVLDVCGVSIVVDIATSNGEEVLCLEFE